ncbi:mRNA splicing protein prp18 [Xylographa opegraphella]|nr:mRNA splicing protein prp18 [Xylographa opegraphella]
MDFASLISAQIAAARPPSPSSSSSKYVKRSTVESARQEAYLAEQRALADAKALKLSQKRQREEEEAARSALREEKKRRLAMESKARREEEEDRKERARRKRLGLPDLPSKEEMDDAAATAAAAAGLKSGEADIEDAELLAKLRALGEPAVLFAETHAQRLRRYYVLVTPKPVMTTGPIPTTLVLVPEAEMKVPLKPPPAGTPERAFLFRQLASYFTMVLTEWAVALAKRPAAVKESFQGRQAYGAMEQSRENMRPLFRRFEKGELEEGILEPVVEIVRSCQERRYVDANDGYLRLSIGKAAWPIGVTMVGIHERSAREKLHESDKGAAHIMSDEVTRKFLQSIKRCLSFAQTRWPPDDQLQLMG